MILYGACDICFVKDIFNHVYFTHIQIHKRVTTPLAGRPRNLSFLKPNYSLPVIHLVVFPHLRPGALHISLQTRKTQPRGWRKRTNEQTRAWVSPQRKIGEVYVTRMCRYPCICRLSRACILHETSTKPQGMLTHLLTALLLSSHCLLLLTVSFLGQLSRADCSLLPSFVKRLSLSSLVPSFPPPLLV